MTRPPGSRTTRVSRDRALSADQPSLALDLDAIKAQTSVTFFRSGGPGGQHRNKVETAVRLVHHPSGLTVVAANERSQRRNLTVAFERLRDKLMAHAAVPRPRVPTKTPASVRRTRLEMKRRQATKKALRHRVEEV
jgi:protein subunit release factor B